MSYCRFSPKSDVYVFETFGGVLECCGCGLSLAGRFKSGTYSEMIAHLEDHRAEGHHVPEYAFERLRQEQAEQGDELKP